MYLYSAFYHYVLHLKTNSFILKFDFFVVVTPMISLGGMVSRGDTDISGIEEKYFYFE